MSMETFRLQTLGKKADNSGIVLVTICFPEHTVAPLHPTAGRFVFSHFTGQE